MTIQQQMKATLEKTGLPYKRIECYGSQIVVTAWSEEAARKWASLLSRFATVRNVVHSREKTRYDDHFRKENPGLVKSAFFHDVWLVGAHV